MGLVLLIGGARSGKSDLALRLAREQSAPVVFIATAQAGDAEMAARIAAHALERPPSWQTIEEPLQLQRAIDQAADGDCVVLDCLTLWSANALEALGVAETEEHAKATARAAAARTGLTIVVTNEVGLGIVPTDGALSRTYRDLLGRVNAIWADAADRVYLLIAGRVLALEKTDALGELSP
jgi:adenosyl cobinamide kinase/adenosyl cobinamide phosphate guanylyltransferase